MQTALSMAVLAMSLAAVTGCTHREVVAFADHDSKPLTALNVDVHKSYVFWSSAEFVFYSCSEQGSQLTCRRLCGGSSDIVCPAAYANGSGVSTNIR